MFVHAKEFSEHVRASLEQRSPHGTHKHWLVPTCGNIFWFSTSWLTVFCMYLAKNGDRYQTTTPLSSSLSTGTIVAMFLTALQVGLGFSVGLTYGYSNTLFAWWKANFLCMHVMHTTPSLTVPAGTKLDPQQVHMWYSLRQWYQNYPMRANYYIGSGVLSTFLVMTVLCIGGLMFNVYRGALIRDGAPYYGSVPMIALTCWLVSWCMSCILCAVQTQDTQWQHLKMLYQLRFTTGSDNITPALDVVQKLIEDNDQAPKVFDTIPLNRVFFNSVAAVFFSAGTGIAWLFFAQSFN